MCLGMYAAKIVNRRQASAMNRLLYVKIARRAFEVEAEYERCKLERDQARGRVRQITEETGWQPT